MPAQPGILPLNDAIQASPDTLHTPGVSHARETGSARHAMGSERVPARHNHNLRSRPETCGRAVVELAPFLRIEGLYRASMPLRTCPFICYLPSM